MEGSTFSQDDGIYTTWFVDSKNGYQAVPSFGVRLHDVDPQALVTLGDLQLNGEATGERPSSIAARLCHERVL